MQPQGTVNLRLACWPHSKNTCVPWAQIRAHRANIPWVLGFLYLLLPLAMTGNPSQVRPVVSPTAQKVPHLAHQRQQWPGLSDTSSALHRPALDLLTIRVFLELQGEGQTGSRKWKARVWGEMSWRPRGPKTPPRPRRAGELGTWSAPPHRCVSVLSSSSRGSWLQGWAGPPGSRRPSSWANRDGRSP